MEPLNHSKVTEPPLTDRQELTFAVKAAAHQVGFELVGIAPAVSPPGFAHLKEWLDQGFAGEMNYLGRRSHAYEHPEHVMPTVRSIVMLAINYNTESRSGNDETSSSRSGRVARYARGPLDYHDLLRGKLKQLAETLHELRPGCRTRGVVDTAPLLERDFARLAGLGWFGKNTMLINKRAGSWLLLAALLTDLDLTADLSHETSHCGTCTRCLDVCPTDAFAKPYVLDARRCIAYLTIEHKGSIPEALRPHIGGRIYGCDDCAAACPWNRFAQASREAAFAPRPAVLLDLRELLALDAEQFREIFRGSPIARIKRRGLLRNVCVALGNTGTRADLPALERAAADPDPLIAEHAIWASLRLPA